MKRKNINKGAAFFFMLFMLLFFVLFGRFFYIQKNGEVQGKELKNYAEQLYQKNMKIEASRGTIYDQNGLPLAEDIPAYNIIAVLDKSQTTNKKKPRHVVDKELTAEKLAPLLGIPEEEILSRLKKKHVFQVEFGSKGKGLSHETKSKIDDLELPGIIFNRTSKRFYPNGVFSSHTIGFSRINEEGNSEGVMGLEKKLDSVLKEKDGIISFEKDFFGMPLPNSKEDGTEAKNGNNVYLTIDQKIQTFLEDAMNEVDKKYKPKEMMAIVADPKTGEILATSSRPTFDPNKRDIKNYMNTPIEYPFEPGSTMKIYTLAAAIEEGVWSPTQKYKSGSYKISGSTIRDHNGYGWGQITYLEGFQRSSNVAMATLTEKYITFDKFYDYLLKFGFDRLTGVDLPNERSGRILYHYPVEKATTTFGQGTAITPIQQIQAATSIANNGKMMKPYIVKKIVDSKSGKEELVNSPKVAGNPISADTAKQVRDILGTVVTSEHGTGKAYNIPGYEVAGKTGTAQIPGPDGKYLTGWDNYIFSFMGMVPKDDPELLMYVAVKQPQLDDKKYEPGSAPVSQIFNTVMKNSLQYLNIRPDNSTDNPNSWQGYQKVSQNYVSRSTIDAKESAAQDGFVPVVIGDGTTIINQSPLPNQKRAGGERVILVTNGDWKMPNLATWSLRDVMKLEEALNIRFKYQGNGYVFEQSIPAGRTIREDDLIQVDLSPPNETGQKKEDTKVKDGTSKPLD